MSKIPELLKERATWLRKQAETELASLEALGHCATHLLEKAAEESKSLEIAEQFLAKAKAAGAEERLSALCNQVKGKISTNPFDVAATKIADAANLGTITKEAAEVIIAELQRRKGQ